MRRISLHRLATSLARWFRVRVRAEASRVGDSRPQRRVASRYADSLARVGPWTGFMLSGSLLFFCALRASCARVRRTLCRALALRLTSVPVNEPRAVLTSDSASHFVPPPP